MSAKIRLRHFSLGPEWNSFFRSLPGWTAEKNHFTDGLSRALLRSAPHTSDVEQRVTLDISDGKLWNEAIGIKGLRKTESKCLDGRSPSGLPVRVRHTPDDPADKPDLGFVMNHIAITALRMEEESDWWKQLLRSRHVLAVKGGWDPIVDGPLDTSHFYQERSFYITIRKESPEGQLHHIGWETEHIDNLRGIREMLGSLRLEIFWEGQLDGSHVLHFLGPDGRVHDFFVTSERIRGEAA